MLARFFFCQAERRGKGPDWPPADSCCGRPFQPRRCRIQARSRDRPAKDFPDRWWRPHSFVARRSDGTRRLRRHGSWRNAVPSKGADVAEVLRRLEDNDPVIARVSDPSKVHTCGTAAVLQRRPKSPRRGTGAERQRAGAGNRPIHGCGV